MFKLFRLFKLWFGDENIFEDNSENYYENDSIYILHYANAEEAKISFGKGLEKVNDYDIKHFCHTEPGSSGGPILNKKTNKEKPNKQTKDVVDLNNVRREKESETKNNN